MLTVVETPLFQRQWPLYWTRKNEALSPLLSLSIPLPEMLCPNRAASAKCVGGVQVRASPVGFGSSTSRATAQGEVVLLTLYAKSKTDNLTGTKLKEIRRAIEQ